MLISYIMIFLPANKYHSLDIKWGFTKEKKAVPYWINCIFIIQIAIVYFYASVAKIYPDWLDGTFTKNLLQGTTSRPFFLEIFAKKRFFLVDLNIDLLSFVYRILDVPLVFEKTQEFGVYDGDSEYDQISAKKDWTTRSIYQNRSYRQCFGTEFVANLSVLDLIMNYGIESREILQKSLNK